ncbi:MAG: LytTR family transcriptional regulator DNA-binding domain-containing protein [Turicibacter sp.]|nr:LytTR family transcriptional regulator DNA-binding domain-containing protein [Turicibacter sp.]
MKIIIQNPIENEEDSIVINVKNMTDKVMRALEILKSPDDVSVQLDNQTFKLPIPEIFYVESVDFKTFVCAESVVYQSKLKLYEIEAVLGQSDFLKISRQVTVNVGKIRSVASAGGGRIEVMLANGEKLIVSRQYAPDLKERFGL